jgi:GAF domain-containing protein
MWLSSGARGVPDLILWAGLVIFTAAICKLTYHWLGLVSHGEKLAESNAELARTNATLNESVAALRAARQELARQKMLAENLLTVARATGQRPALEATLQNTLTIFVALTGATHGSLFLLDAERRITHHLLTRREHEIGSQEAHARIGQVMTEGLAGLAVRQKAPVRVADTLTDPRWLSLSNEARPTRSAMAVPLISRQMPVGVITLISSTPNHFTEEHEHLLNDATDQVALALDNAQMFERMTHLADRLSLLYEISQEARQPDLEAALAKTVRAIRASTGWPTVAAILLDNDQTPVIHASVGDAAQEILVHRLPSGEGLVALAISTAQSQRACEGTAAMAAPICLGQRVMGVLGTHSTQLDCFTEDDLDLLSSVADTLAMAVAYAELSKRQTD